MAVAVRTNGLHHAVSLGAIEVSSKGCSNRNYDSEDEVNRRRLRHTSSTELYPRTSIYSKGDIREQYCLTDRQLNSIERPRREGFFGCLSRRNAHRSQSFLGVCVGRRAPSDENLAAYAPFHKNQRHYPCKREDFSPDQDRDNLYFRRQPASILSTGKMTNDSIPNERDDSYDTRQNWITRNNNNLNPAANIAPESLSKSSYNCPSHSGLQIGHPAVPPNIPRTKHVSFARSHTLTSFNDTNFGFHSLDRLKAAQSQERLIGGKKPSLTGNQGYDQHQLQNQYTETGPAPFTVQHPHQPQLLPTGQPHMHPLHTVQPRHTHPHHHLPLHIHQFVPTYNPTYLGKVQTEQTIPLGVGVIACAAQAMPPPSPEVVVVEKKFRSAMKTQATQTDPRKEANKVGVEPSPHSMPKSVRVVSQGAQTNGMLNKLKMAKNSFDMPNERMKSKMQYEDQQMQMYDDENVHFSQIVPFTPLQVYCDSQNNIEYYERPPAPQSVYRRSSYPSIEDRDNAPTSNGEDEFNGFASRDYDYESHSLPRRMCSHQRPPADYTSHSLPRTNVMESTPFYNEPQLESLEFSPPPLLPPPLQYCKDSNDEEDYESIEKKWISPARHDTNRRKSLATVVIHDHDHEHDSPFRRDDFRRQSMPVYVKTERLIDGYAPRSSFRLHERSRRKFNDDSDEKEILIDFKPHMSPKPSPKIHLKYRKTQKMSADPQRTQIKITQAEKDDVSSSLFDHDDVQCCHPCERYDFSAQNPDELSKEHGSDEEDHLYENVPPTCSCVFPSKKREHFRKRSVSLDDAESSENKPLGVSSPPSPCREDIANASTYPSSDSLANDVTRDHSDGIWNESQATVLTADQKEQTDNSYLSSNLLLTPSSRRRSLILQHQQRSSVDTDALDFEDQLTDHSPIYTNLPISKASRTIQPGSDSSSTHLSIKSQECKVSSSTSMKTGTPSIAITPSQNIGVEVLAPQDNRQRINRRQAKAATSTNASQGARKVESSHPKQKNMDKTRSFLSHSEQSYKFNVTNTDVSECSTNTDEYATCTDTSRRTQGIKTPPTTTSSSSTTQVPVSTQSSQMDKSHGSSFESASSLHSSRGEILAEDIPPIDEGLSLKPMTEILQGPTSPGDTMTKSPSHSLCSTSSSESYKVAVPPYPESVKEVLDLKEKPKPKHESVSDDERSERRYSSSGYYESPPHDDVDEIVTKFRRNRLEEDRKRRKTSMKLDIEKENMRALTSPIRKPAVPTVSAVEPILETPNAAVALTETTSPNKVKRLRPKIRRQLRRSSRDDSAQRRPNQKPGVYYAQLQSAGNTEKLLDCSIKATSATSPAKIVEEKPKPNIVATSGVKSASEGGAVGDSCRLKAKSTESLRSVSPGSDSVFYSEADGTGGDQHCQHCGKDAEAGEMVSNIHGGDSVESIPYIENEEQGLEQDIVKPPSDFADSPVTTKTTHRLYKKMDRRFRSEERGRHYKTRQENLRAKSEERNREQSLRSPHTLRPSGSSPCVLPDVNADQTQQIIYRGHYDAGRYARLTDSDVWAQLDHQSFDRHKERRASTESERSFHSKYQVILHRLVQRRCTLEMYHRQKSNVFGVDKTVVVKSDSGEFGFRIHGSKPVVVAAIEPDTPAESSGLEVGDIIISVNGTQVLDKHHTEVVKIAHDGCETLELKVARTIGVLMNEQHEPPFELIYSGYLWRQSGQAKGLPNAKKWVRRWFCLRSDNCLYYYKTEGSTQPVGAMIMAKHTVELCPPEVGKLHAFKVDSGEGIPLYVAGDSEDGTSHWIKLLKQAAAQTNPWIDNCARYLYQQPSSVTRPDCFGSLLKLGSRWCGWSKRYCVLKDACLYFYQDANSKAAFGMACLHGYKVATMSTNTSGKKNSFEIIPPEPKLRHYYFSAESEMDKKRWISALEYSIDRWIKSG